MARLPQVVTDFLSFYTLPSTVIGNPKHNNLKVRISKALARAAHWLN